MLPAHCFTKGSIKSPVKFAALRFELAVILKYLEVKTCKTQVVKKADRRTDATDTVIIELRRTKFNNLLFKNGQIDFKHSLLLTRRSKNPLLKKQKWRRKLVKYFE